MSDERNWEVVESGVMGDFPYAITRASWKFPESLPESTIKLIGKEWFCGYIGLSPSHPWYGKDNDEIPIQCHGGLTFAQREHNDREYNMEQMKYLHATMPTQYGGEGLEYDQEEFDKIPKYLPKEPNEEAYPIDTGMDVWQIGFDCHHGYDHDEETGESMWRPEEVRYEIQKMVAQAAKVASEYHSR